jgi:sugar phosphate isomerase/epimerase
MTAPTRRTFLHSTLALSAGSTLAWSRAEAIEPIPRQGRSRMRLSIAAYSYRDYLTGKRKPAMTLEDYVDVAAELGVDAVEPTSYYFQDTSPAYLARLKGRCTRLGLDISGTAVGNNFCHQDPAKLKEEIDKVKQWVERAAILGGKTIRIFAGNVPAGDTEENARRRCVAAIQEACDHAGKHGIYLALENHGGITATPERMLAIVKEVKHDWFGVNLDSGNFHTEDPYADLAKIAPYAVIAQVKTEIQRAGQKKEEADLKRILQLLRDVNYRGYVALEYEAAEDPREAIPRHVDVLKKLLGSSA